MGSLEVVLVHDEVREVQNVRPWVDVAAGADLGAQLRPYRQAQLLQVLLVAARQVQALRGTKSALQGNDSLEPS